MTYTTDRYRVYRQSEHGRKAIGDYEQSDAARERKRRYRSSPKGQAVSREREAARRRRVRDAVLSAKQQPCADCGGTFDPICMDFHHVRGTKKFQVGQGKHDIPTVIAEIAKCVVICANCHRLRHKQQ